MNHRIVRRVLGALLVLQAVAMAACGAFAYFDVVAADGELRGSSRGNEVVFGGVDDFGQVGVVRGAGTVFAEFVEAALIGSVAIIGFPASRGRMNSAVRVALSC